MNSHDTIEQHRRQETSGEEPIRSLYATAVVRYDKMYVLGGRDRDDPYDTTTREKIDAVHILGRNSIAQSKIYIDFSIEFSVEFC